MKQRIITILLALVATCGAATVAHAQHVFGVKGGWGASTARFYPKQEMRMMWGGYTGGVTWRHYSVQPFVGAVGADVEFMKRGYSYYPYFSSEDPATKALRYTRHINSVLVPIVWQPHFYLANFRLRVYVDLAVTFAYNISSTYINELQNASGTYHFKLVRDNRWNYGLAGGGGVAYLAGRNEFSVGARYYFGYGDIVRNTNRYSGNATDGPENPFATTPRRSPIDNIYITLGYGVRVGKADEFASFERMRANRVRRAEKRRAEAERKAAKAAAEAASPKRAALQTAKGK
ncbi:MAG: PorT family protein [Rikenellaceae bacterium]|nr:PorT family protein [Rikenellaceae bacterium]MBR2420362.1 PorT family protein [Rikenellaceae bacterium]MBR3801153.1 PorT family protein [Rikenellaceae bacterium]